MSEGVSMTDEEIEKKINELGLTEFRLSLNYINDQIVKEAYLQVEGTTTTICYLTLKSGFVTIGESGCISPENFNEELGRKLAFQKAKDKIWELEGYFAKKLLSMTKTPEGKVLLASLYDCQG